MVLIEIVGTSLASSGGFSGSAIPDVRKHLNKWLNAMPVGPVSRVHWFCCGTGFNVRQRRGVWMWKDTLSLFRTSVS